MSQESIALQSALDEITQLKLDIKREIMCVEYDMKEHGSLEYLQRVHTKKTYQCMGLYMCEAIIKKRIKLYEV